MRTGAALLPVALLVVACPLGCSKPSSGGAVAFAAFGDLKPDAAPGEQARLIFGSPKGEKGALSTEFDVTVRHEAHDKTVSIDLETQGETVERELYETSSDAFRLVSTSEDSFAPGIDLLHFPAKEADEWSWDGKVSYGGISRPAQATIKVKKEGSGLVSEVALKIQADAGRPDLDRTLKFWFEKDKGVVRRSFGEVSIRQPVGDSWQP